MKKIVSILILGIFANGFCKSQEVKIFYGDIVTYFVSQPTYLFQKDCPNNNVITITDESFIHYLDSICTNAVISNNTDQSEVTPGMIQIIYKKTPQKYYTINMSHSLSSSTISSGFLEIDGEMKMFSPAFQVVIDEIVNYHIHYPQKNINSTPFLSAIIKGKRYHYSGIIIPDD